MLLVIGKGVSEISGINYELTTRRFSRKHAGLLMTDDQDDQLQLKKYKIFRRLFFGPLYIYLDYSFG